MREKSSIMRCRSTRAVPVFLYVSILLVTLFACNEDERFKHTGFLKFSMEVDDASLSSSVPTKSSEEFAEFKKTVDYKVEILQGTTSVKAWDRLDKMPENVELESGSYLLKVSKGNNEGAAFESPYFEGSSKFIIQEGMTTPIAATASLANAKVTVEYSSDFLEAYKSYKLTFKSAKMNMPIVYKQDEARSLYFQCDTVGTKVELGMELVNIYGKDVAYKASFTAKPKSWIRLNVKTDGEAINGVSIDIILNDEVIKTEHVQIGIPDFMDKLKGGAFFIITENSPFHWLSEQNPEPMVMDVGSFGTNASLNINAPGKIGNCQLTIANEAETVFDYDLANLTASQTTTLEERWNFSIGSEPGANFPKEAKEQYEAYLDLLDILNELDGSSSEVTYTGVLKVTDLMPIPNVTEATFKVKLNAVAAPAITFNEAFITEMNEGDLPEGKTEADQVVSILAMGRIKTCVLKITEGTNELFTKEITTVGTSRDDIVWSKAKGNKSATLSFKEDWFKSLQGTPDGVKVYKISLELTDYVDNQTVQDLTVTVKPPVFEWAMADNDGDVFAKHAVLRVKAPNMENVVFYHDGEPISTTQGLVAQKGIISFVWKGLNSQTAYSNITAKYKQYSTPAMHFTTETEVYLGEKGKLENWTAEGGEGHGDVKWGNYSHTPNRSWENWIVKDWGTLNEKTTQLGAENKKGPGAIFSSPPRNWTRYVANSGTIRTNGNNGGYAALIRTVGWGYNNSAMGGTSNTIDEIDPGELYLGVLDKQNKIPAYGINFSYRPLGFSFKYKYKSKDKDRFIAKIEVKSGDETIAEAQFNSSEIGEENNWTDAKVLLEYIGKNASLKATSMYLLFKSGISKEKDDIIHFASFSNLTTGENIGSQLYIDDVELIYDYE